MEVADTHILPPHLEKILRATAKKSDRSRSEVLRTGLLLLKDIVDGKMVAEPRQSSES
jgi:hypothetical protein